MGISSVANGDGKTKISPGMIQASLCTQASELGYAIVFAVNVLVHMQFWNSCEVIHMLSAVVQGDRFRGIVFCFKHVLF